MKKISIITLGCKVNMVESENLAERLHKDGYLVSMGLAAADIYVINTCAVTNEAERKSRNIIAKVLKLNPDAKIYVCGCSSEHNADNFKKGDFVKAIIGNSDKTKLADQIEADDDEFVKSNKSCQNKRITTKTRADLWVQNGCNNFCTYCIIPFLRGREKSFPLKEIEKKVRELETCAKEIVVTGINLSAYGKDIKGCDGLIEIARLFKGSPARFRFSSLEVNVIDEKFLSELAGFDNFCEHFHLSLQSGSNNTLKAMNRHYTKEQYLEKVNLIRKFFPNAGITTDIIIGFPTETDEDFAESLDFAKAVNFSEMHIFPYSKRDGTVAAGFKNIAKNVPERVKKMTEQALKMRTEFIKKNKGKTFEVIIENQKEGFVMAHTKNFILCYIQTDEALLPNEVKKIKIIKPFKEGAIAKIIK